MIHGKKKQAEYVKKLEHIFKTIDVLGLMVKYNGPRVKGVWLWNLTEVDMYHHVFQSWIYIIKSYSVWQNSMLLYRYFIYCIFLC